MLMGGTPEILLPLSFLMSVTVTVTQSDPTFPGELQSLEGLWEPSMHPWELLARGPCSETSVKSRLTSWNFVLNSMESHWRNIKPCNREGRV